MKVLLISFLLFSVSAHAAKKSKATKSNIDKRVDKRVNEEQKIYSVPETKPEILIGNQSQLPPVRTTGRADKLYYVGISKSALTYKTPSLINPASEFKQDLIGISLGRKTANNLFYYRGHFEMDAEWMRFKRTSSVFEQRINVFQFDLIQNIDLAYSLKHSVYFSAGFGVAPMYLLGEQSVFGNSFAELGGSGILKFDLIFPFKKFYEADLGLKTQWGRAGGHDLFLSSLNLGINFE
jgi:hypothetical protein